MNGALWCEKPVPSDETTGSPGRCVGWTREAGREGPMVPGEGFTEAVVVRSVEVGKVPWVRAPISSEIFNVKQAVNRSTSTYGHA